VRDRFQPTPVDDLPASAKRFSRRSLLFGAAVAATALAACDSPIPATVTPDTRPKGPPTPTEIPIARIGPEKPDVISLSVPFTKGIRRAAEFPDISSLLDRYKNTETYKKFPDEDTLQTLHGPSRPNVPDPIDIYYSHKEDKLYSGFGYFGQDDKIAGDDYFKDLSIGIPKVYMTDVPGNFGYSLVGKKDGKRTKYAFVMANVQKGEKTVITIDDLPDLFDFEFAVSADASTIGINLINNSIVPSPQAAQAGAYIIDATSLKTIAEVHEQVNGLRLSQDGKKIYSASFSRARQDWGKGKIIDLNSKQVEPVDFRSNLGWRHRENDVVSPNLEYLATEEYMDSESTKISGLNGTIIKSPRGYLRLTFVGSTGVRSITNDGIIKTKDGIRIDGKTFPVSKPES
jgi:hypothetical protein